MITSLEVPYIDVSASSLTFRPDAPSLPVLDSIERDAGALRVSLRLLGASHQVVVATPDGFISETLAYRDDLPADLPGEFTQRIGGWRHHYSCTVEKMDVPKLRERLRDIRRRSDEPDLLIGVFGGHPDALTAIEVTGDDPLAWSTVHTYPQHSEIVTTAGSVTRIR